MDRKTLGKKGEDIAAKYLIKKGYYILKRNYRLSHQEIDIIARDRDVVAFVEVKTFKSERFGRPKEAVDWRKQRKIAKVALGYLSQEELGEIDARFDVVAIKMSSDTKVKDIELIKDAFRVDEIFF